MLNTADAAAIARDWQSVRADSSIQFAPVPPPAPPRPPQWLQRLQEWLTDAMGPLAEGLVRAWPVLKWVLIVSAALLAAWLLWRLLAPLAGWRIRPRGESEWTPDRQEALILLEDADALAAAGRFDEATHLLLQRSVGQIRRARPEWLDPSSTAREIAALPALPARARRGFGIIANRVERSLFALRPLEAADWQAARAAYAEFTLERLEADAS